MSKVWATIVAMACAMTVVTPGHALGSGGPKQAAGSPAPIAVGSGGGPRMIDGHLYPAEGDYIPLNKWMPPMGPDGKPLGPAPVFRDPVGDVKSWWIAPIPSITVGKHFVWWMDWSVCQGEQWGWLTAVPADSDLPHVDGQTTVSLGGRPNPDGCKPPIYTLTNDLYVTKDVAVRQITAGVKPELKELSPSENGSPDHVLMSLDDYQVNFPDVQPYLETAASRVLVPIRFPVEALGGKAGWDGATRTVTLDLAEINTTVYRPVYPAGVDRYTYDPQWKDDPIVVPAQHIVMHIGSRDVLVNGTTVHLDVAPTIKDGRTMVPLRFLMELGGMKVYWFGAEGNLSLWPDTGGAYQIWLISPTSVRWYYPPADFERDNVAHHPAQQPGHQ